MSSANLAEEEVRFVTRQLANGKRLWVAQRLMWAEHELRQAARSLEEAKALPDLHRELHSLADVVAGHVSVVKRGRSDAGTAPASSNPDAPTG